MALKVFLHLLLLSTLLEWTHQSDQGIDSMQLETLNDNSMYSNIATDAVIPDQTAIAGRIFDFALPDRLCKHMHDGGSIQINDVKTDALPERFYLDIRKNRLLGIPDERDIGREHRLQVLSLPPQINADNSYISADNSQTTKDIFSIKVIEDSDHISEIDNKLNKNLEKSASESFMNRSGEIILSASDVLDSSHKDNNLKRIQCSQGSSITRATVIIDVDMEELLPKSIVELMSDFANHLNMSSDLLRIIPQKNRPVFDSSALVAGVGDKKEVESRDGSLLQWEVGCGNVQAYHMPILQKLETSSVDGTMSQALGKGVVGWHVTNNRPSSKPLRLKRRAALQENQRRSQASKYNEFEEEGSGFYSPTETLPIVTPEDVPEKTKKPKNRTRKPRPNKTRHHHRTRRPKPTDPVVLDTTTTTAPTVTTTTTTAPPLETTQKKTDEIPFEKSSEKMTTMSTTIVNIPEIPMEEVNVRPKVVRQMPTQNVEVGDILHYRIPARTFYDEEDGNTRKLRLDMLTVDMLSITNNSWVQFDNRTQTIIGIPMNMHIGTYEYLLIAVDKNDQIARMNFEIKVSKKPSGSKINHEMSMKLDLNYDRFIEDVYQRLNVVNKISKIYGDDDFSKITVTKVERGSVDFAWTNNSIPTEGCPIEEINKLVSYLVIDDKNLNPVFVNGMAPYKVIAAGVFPKGDCVDDWVSTTTERDMEVIIIDKTIPNKDNGKDEGINTVGDGSMDKPDDTEINDINEEDNAVKTRDSSQDDKLVTTIIPVVVITTMIILAIIIACCLYRKNRGGKHADEDPGTFVTKGIPVIFADELEDKPDPPSKPLIMREEKPPLPPPHYPRSNSGGSLPSTPGSGHREPLLDNHTYNRPPPVHGSNSSKSGSMGRRLPRTPPSNHQQHYRQPPPYTNIPP